MEISATPAGATENRRIMVALALSLLLASLGTSIANIALPRLAEAFAAPFHHVQWVVIAYLATLTVFAVFAGRLGDIHGLRRMHLAGLGLYAVSSLLCGLAPNLWLLIGARALQGIGAAFLMTLSLALVRETVGDARLGRAMGLLGTVSALGTALGPSLGGLVMSTTGWQGIFVLQVPFAVLALVLAFTSLPQDAARTTLPKAGFGMLRGAAPLSGLVVNLLVAAVMMTTLFVGPFYLGLGLGLDDVRVGLIMSVGPAISIFSGIPSGSAVDAWGAPRIVAAGLVLLTTGAFALAVLPGVFGVLGYILAVTILTPGYQLFQAANNTAVFAGIAGDRRGTVAGLLGLSRNLGLILGASVMGAVFAFGVGTGDFQQAPPAAITNGLRLVFGLAGVLMVAALGVALRQTDRRALH